MIAMEIVLVILAFLFLAAGLLGAVVPVIPGPPLCYLGLLVLQWSGYGNFSLTFLLVLLTITVAVTIMDNVLPALLTKKFGGSHLAVIGSILGLVIGMIFFPPVGLIVGPFLGALAGELIHSRTYDIKALKVALGAFLAFILGTGAKLIISLLMIYYAVMAMIT
jgi:uncharacterized protein YqgC (DUF456 family)